MNERDEAFEKWTQSGAPVSLHSAFHAHDAELADLQHQLREHEEAAATAMRILLEGRPGAAQNAVQEDYPSLVALRDAYVQEKVSPLHAEIKRLQDIISHDRDELRKTLYGPDWGFGKDPKELFARVAANRAECESVQEKVDRAVLEESVWARKYWHEHDSIDGMSYGHGGDIESCGFCIDHRERVAAHRAKVKEKGHAD